MNTFLLFVVYIVIKQRSIKPNKKIPKVEQQSITFNKESKSDKIDSSVRTIILCNMVSWKLD